MSVAPVNGAGRASQVPPSFRFAANPRTTQDTGSWKTVLPDIGGGPVQAGQMVQWICSADGMMDPSSLCFEGKFELLDVNGNVVGSSDNARILAPGPWSAINQFDIYAGNDEVSSSKNYSVMHSIVHKYGMDDVNADLHQYVSGADAYPAFGIYSNSARNKIPGTRSGDQVLFCPLVGLTAQTQYVPLPFLKNVGFVFRITLEQAANCMYLPAGTSAVSYRWSEPRMRYRITEPNPELFAASQAAWIQGLYALDLNSYDWFPYSGKAGAGTETIVLTDQASNVQAMFWIVRETIKSTNDPLRNVRWFSPMYGTTGNATTTGQAQIEINGTLYPERPMTWSRGRTEEVYYLFADAMRSIKAVPNQMMNVFVDRHASDRTYSLMSVEDNYRSGLVDSCVMGMRFDAFTTAESNAILSGPDTRSAAGRIALTLTHEAFTSFFSKTSGGAFNDTYTTQFTNDTNLTWDFIVVTKRRILMTPDGVTTIL